MEKEDIDEKGECFRVGFFSLFLLSFVIACMALATGCSGVLALDSISGSGVFECTLSTPLSHEGVEVVLTRHSRDW